VSGWKENMEVVSHIWELLVTLLTGPLLIEPLHHLSIAVWSWTSCVPRIILVADVGHGALDCDVVRLLFHS
jgi:hypothetical protein